MHHPQAEVGKAGKDGGEGPEDELDARSSEAGDVGQHWASGLRVMEKVGSVGKGVQLSSGAQ